MLPWDLALPSWGREWHRGLFAPSTRKRARVSATATRSLMLEAIPHLRAFAISLSGDLVRSDDLVQEALLKGLTSLDRFEPGTNMRAWLFTILRNLFLSERKRRRREVEDVDGAFSSRVPVLPEQGRGWICR